MHKSFYFKPCDFRFAENRLIVNIQKVIGFVCCCDINKELIIHRHDFYLFCGQWNDSISVTLLGGRWKHDTISLCLNIISQTNKKIDTTEIHVKKIESFMNLYF